MKKFTTVSLTFSIMIMFICSAYYSAAQSWKLVGNSATNSSSNFIGTTDLQPLKFRINNIPAGELNPINGNTALGVNTLLLNTTGTGNVAIGTNALYHNTTGRNLVAIGDSALFNYKTLLPIGSNTAIGSKALFSATGAYRCTAIGFQSIYSGTGGYDNVANGYQALFSNSNGNSNTGIGSKSLYLNTTGSRNTAIGAFADVSNSALVNATAIGYGTIVSASNSLVLGNGANVGIGTSAPNTKLQVNGGYIRITEAESGTNLRLGGLYGKTGIWSDAGALNIGAIDGNPILLQNGGSANGNVGIGTLLPAYKLSVQSSVVEANNNTNLLSLIGRNPVIAFNDEENIGYGYLKSLTNAPNAGYSKGMEFGAAPGYSIFFSISYTPAMMIANNGYVGIGTSNPTYRLSVNGTIQSKEIRVETGWSDYVFEKNYKLRSLKNVADYIEQNKHLPGIPSAKQIQKNGLAVGEVQTKMMEKIEELTLYLIEQNKQIQQLQKKIEVLEKVHAK